MKEQRKVNILFLGGAKRVSLAEHFIAAGRRVGLSVGIYSYELQHECPIAAVGTVIIGKRWNDEALRDDLMRVVAGYQIHVILPFVDPAVEVLARLKKDMPGVFIPVSQDKACAIMFDKKLAETWFKENGIPTPVSYSAGDEPSFPVILKPRRGSASKGIRIIRTKEEWALAGNLEDYVVQQYIEDKQEYTVDCYVASANKVVSVVPRERLEVAGGEVLTSRTVHDEVIERLSYEIMHSGWFRGPVTIQFIRDRKTGKTYVMEINPRLGGGVIASIEAGADIPTYILMEWMGKEVPSCDDWRENTLMTRYYKEVMFYADNH